MEGKKWGWGAGGARGIKGCLVCQSAQGWGRPVADLALCPQQYGRTRLILVVCKDTCQLECEAWHEGREGLGAESDKGGCCTVWLDHACIAVAAWGECKRDSVNSGAGHYRQRTGPQHQGPGLQQMPFKSGQI